MIDIEHFQQIIDDPRLSIDTLGLILSYNTNAEKSQITEFFQANVANLPISQQEVDRIEAGMYQVRTGPELQHARALNNFLNNADAVWEPNVDNWWEQAAAEGGGANPPGGGDDPPPPPPGGGGGGDDPPPPPPGGGGGGDDPPPPPPGGGGGGDDPPPPPPEGGGDVPPLSHLDGEGDGPLEGDAPA